jgi:hypothetical protein
MNKLIVPTIYIFTIVLFFMPWVDIGRLDTISVRLNGLDMAKGVFSTTVTILSNNPVSELLAVFALAAAIAGLVTSFLKHKAAMIITAAAGAAGAALLAGIKYTIDNYINDVGLGMVQTSYLPGYWMVIGAFAITFIISAWRIIPRIKKIPAAKSSKS